MPRQNQTTIKISNEEVLCLLDALEGQLLDDLSIEEVETHDRLMKRLARALDRV